jgi:hypothetical protein
MNWNSPRIGGLSNRIDRLLGMTARPGANLDLITYQIEQLNIELQAERALTPWSRGQMIGASWPSRARPQRLQDASQLRPAARE